MGAVWHGPPPSRGIRVGRGCDGLGLYERAIELRDGRGVAAWAPAFAGDSGGARV